MELYTSIFKKGHPIKILIIDDDEDCFALIRDLLHSSDRFNFEIDWVSTYEEASGCIARQEYDVYLIDYILRGRTGLDIIRESRENNSKAPFILFSGVEKKNLDIKSIEGGATFFMDKMDMTLPQLERNIYISLRHERSKAYLEKTLVNVISERVKSQNRTTTHDRLSHA